ncbi:MAG: radical SAM protein [bacterium]
MKVLLVKPPYKVAYFYGLGRHFVPPPLAEACLAAWLKKEGIEVEVLDCQRKDIGWEKLPAILKEKQPEIVGVSASMATFHNDYIRFIKIAKQTNPRVITVAGGGHFGLIPNEIFESCKELDFLVIGEGEVTLTELIREIEKDKLCFKKIKGLAYMENGKVVITPSRPLIQDLDVLPYPDFDLLDMENNHFSALPSSWGKWTILVTARGCIGRCNFCTARLSQPGYRVMSSKRAFELLQAACKRGIRTIWMDDLTFNINKKRTEEIFDRIIESGIELNLILLGRTDFICRDRDILHKYRKAGVQAILLGGESPIQEDLDCYHKGTISHTIEDAIKFLREHDIASWVFFMIGEWHHDKKAIMEILNYADRVDPDVAVFSIVTPLPGTEYFKEMKEKGAIEIFDYTYYDMTYAVMHTKYLSIEEIQSVQAGAPIIFYQNSERMERKVNSKNEFTRNWYERIKAYAGGVHIHGINEGAPSMGRIVETT